jgi:hypothetical protein
LPGFFFMAKSRGSAQTLIQQSRRIGSAQKAQYHEIEGAGRSHIRRPFFELNDDDISQVLFRLEIGVERLLKESR